MTLNWFAWALLSAVFAALTTILAKVGLAQADSDAGTWVRTGVILLCVSALMTAAGKWNAVAQLTPRHWWFLAFSGLAAAASWLCYFRALQAGDVAQVSMVDRSSAVLVILFAVAFLSERPNPHEWAGIGLVVAGLALIALGK